MRRLTPILLTLLFLAPQLGMALYVHTCSETGQQKLRLGWDFSCCLGDGCVEDIAGITSEKRGCCKDEFLQKLSLEDDFSSSHSRLLPEWSMCILDLPLANNWALEDVYVSVFDGFEIAACPAHGPPVSPCGREVLLRKQVWNI